MSNYLMKLNWEVQGIKCLLILSFCSLYFIYLTLMFHAGTLGDSKAGLYGSPIEAIEIEDLAMKLFVPILTNAAFLFISNRRAQLITRVFFSIVILPFVGFLIFIIGIHFTGMGINF